MLKLVLFSSGVDSSYLVSLAKPDKTYTIGFDLAKYSEIDYAKDLTDKLNIKNISEKISKEEYMNAFVKYITIWMNLLRMDVLLLYTFYLDLQARM